MNFEKIALSEVCDLIPGFAFKSKEFSETLGEKVIKIGDIVPPYVKVSTFVDCSKYDSQKLEKYKVHFGDCLLAMTGATIGKVGRFYGDEAFVNQRVLMIKPKEFVNANYIYALLCQSHFQSYIRNHIDSETAQPNISASSIGKYPINLPSNETQDWIGKIYELLTEKVRHNSLINDNLVQQAESIFAHEFLMIDTIPDGWKKSSLLGIAKYLNGLAMQKYRPNDDGQGLPVLKIRELRQGFCDANSELCSPSIESEYIIHDGDVIFSWSGSLLVDLWCGGTCGLNQHLFKVTSSTYDKWFYYSWTNHHLQKFAAIAADMATTMGHIKRGELEKAEVLIPSQSDYDRIGGLLAPLYDLIIANRIENRKLASLRDELLPKLLSGELDVLEAAI